MDDDGERSALERRSRDAADSPHDASFGISTEREGFAAAHGAERNRFLRALPFEEYARLLPRLTPVRLGLKQALVEPETPIRDVYFPRDGVCSILAVEQEGDPIEVGTVGPEGFIGLPVLMRADAFRQLLGRTGRPRRARPAHDAEPARDRGG
jgi:hypothetical protein